MGCSGKQESPAFKPVRINDPSIEGQADFGKNFQDVVESYIIRQNFDESLSKELKSKVSSYLLACSKAGIDLPIAAMADYLYELMQFYKEANKSKTPSRLENKQLRVTTLAFIKGVVDAYKKEEAGPSNPSRTSNPGRKPWYKRRLVKWLGGSALVLGAGYSLWKLLKKKIVLYPPLG